MARAKKTDRADARRRYRSEMAATAADGAGPDGAPATAPATPNSRPKQGAPAYESPPGRLGIREAFSQSIHPVDIRGDLAALPWLATHTKALVIPLGLTVVALIGVLITNGSDIITAFLFAYFVQTPAIGGVFIAGFLAPRASWLLGLIVGLFSAICYAIYIAVASSRTVPTPAPETVRDAVLAAFLLSPAMGVLFASGAAWYRRFLQLSNPNRGRRAEAKKAPAKASARR